MDAVAAVLCNVQYGLCSMLNIAVTVAAALSAARPPCHCNPQLFLQAAAGRS
jgi:hypothetical protein